MEAANVLCWVICIAVLYIGVFWVWKGHWLYGVFNFPSFLLISLFAVWFCADPTGKSWSSFLMEDLHRTAGVWHGLVPTDLYPWGDGRDGSTVVSVLAAAVLRPCPAMPVYSCFAMSCSFHLPGYGCAELVEAKVFLQTGTTESLDVLLEGFLMLHQPGFQ